jgi:hypothetical protein
LILHEEVEKTLIDQLGLHYLHAHQIATRAEEAAVNAQRVTWKAYDRFMQKYVKSINDERLTKVPADLDLKPYRDYHDYDLMERMMKHVERGPGVSAALKAELKLYSAAFRERHRAEHRRARKAAAATDGPPMLATNRSIVASVKPRQRIAGKETVKTPKRRRPVSSK